MTKEGDCNIRPDGDLSEAARKMIEDFKKYRSTRARNSPPNSDKPENKKIETNQCQRDACRGTSSRRKTKVFGADHDVRGLRNHRGATQDQMRFSLTHCNTGYTYLTLLSHRQERVVPEHGLQPKTAKNIAPHYPAQNAASHHSDKQKIKIKTRKT